MADDVLTELSALVRVKLAERQWKKIEAFLAKERFGRPPADRASNRPIVKAR